MKRINVQLFLLFYVALAAIPALGQKLDRAVLAFGSTGPNLTTFWLAREAGLYKQYGLDVDVVFFRGSTIAINALATKDAHFGAFGASSSVLAKLGGMDTVLIATATPGLLFYLVTKKEIRNAADMKGKRIGASRPGTDSDLAARVAVQKLGLGEKDVTILAMGTDSERLAAMTQGVVDATVVTIGGYVAAQKMGFHAILDLSQAQRSLRSGVDDHDARFDQGESRYGAQLHEGFRGGDPIRSKPPGIYLESLKQIYAHG